MKKAELFKELEDWRYELVYYTNDRDREKCPTPKGVKKYILTLSVKIGSQVDIIMALEAEIHKLKIKVERLKKGLPPYQILFERDHSPKE